jgi:hypothetical protein
MLVSKRQATELCSYRSVQIRSSIDKNNQNLGPFLPAHFHVHIRSSKTPRADVGTFVEDYLCFKATLEFRNDARPIRFQTSTYNLYSHGGMTFLLVSSSIFLTVALIATPPFYSLDAFRYIHFCSFCRAPVVNNGEVYQVMNEGTDCALNSMFLCVVRRSFYIYCFVLACINLTQIVGTILNLTETTIYSMWYVGEKVLRRSVAHSICSCNECTFITSLFLNTPP